MHKVCDYYLITDVVVTTMLKCGGFWRAAIIKVGAVEIFIVSVLDRNSLLKLGSVLFYWYGSP